MKRRREMKRREENFVQERNEVAGIFQQRPTNSIDRQPCSFLLPPFLFFFLPVCCRESLNRAFSSLPISYIALSRSGNFHVGPFGVSGQL